MIERLISELLNKNLSKFIENIDEKQLGATLFNSSILLKNMRLKATMFDDSPLPFSLSYGQIGRIFLKIPIWDMFKTPLVVELEDIVAVVGMKPMEQWSEEQQKQAFAESNQDMLAQFELFVKSQIMLKETERESACSFTDKLLARIMDNLQISIKNILFRFEDKLLGQDSSKFTTGMKLKEFCVFTGDENFERMKQVPDEKQKQRTLTYKVAKLEGFSLFCDWEDVDAIENGGIDVEKLREEGSRNPDKKAKAATTTTPASYFQEIIAREFCDDAKQQVGHKSLINDLQVELQIEVNKDIRNPLMPASLDLPQIKATVVIGRQKGEMGTQIKLYQPQLLRVLKTVELIGFFNEFKDGVLSQFEKRKLSSAEKSAYMVDYMAWVHLSRDKKDSGKAKEKHQAMLQIEHQVHHRDIIAIRKTAIEKLQSEDQRQIELNDIEKQIQKQIQKETGLGLFMSDTKRRSIEKAARAKFLSDTEAIKRKYNDKDQAVSQGMVNLINDFQKQDEVTSPSDGSEEKQDVLDFSNLAPDYVRFRVVVSMSSLAFLLENEFGQNITDLQIKGIDFSLAVANKFTKAKLSIENFSIKDLWAQSEIWPDLIQTAQQEGQIEQAVVPPRQEKKVYALLVHFEQNKDFTICPFHLIIKLEKKLQIVANLPLVNEVARTLTLALSNQKLDFEYFMQLALGRVAEIRSTAKQYSEDVKNGKQKHVSVSIEADILAPILIIPANIFDRYSTLIKVDLGSIKLDSNLVNYNDNTDYKLIQDETKLYDVYTLRTRGLSLQIVDEAAHQTSTIVDSVSLVVTVKNCLEPLHPKVPAIQVNFNFVEKIKAQFDFTAVQQVVGLSNQLLVQVKNNIFFMVAQRMSSKEKIVDNIDNNAETLTNEPPNHQQQLSAKIERMRRKTKDANQIQPQEPPNQLVPVDNMKTQDKEADGKGSSILIKFNLAALEIEFASSNHLAIEIESESEYIGLRAELRNLSCQVLIENQAQDITITAGVHKVEATELQSRNVAAKASDTGEFDKIIFWNQSESAMANLHKFKKPGEAEELQLQALIKVNLGESEFEDQMVAETKVGIDVKVRQTIFVCKMTTVQKVLCNAFKIVKLVKFDTFDEKEKVFQQKNAVIEALADCRCCSRDQKQPGTEQVPRGKPGAQHLLIKKIYENLARENGKNEPAAIKQFLNACTNIIENSDVDLKAKKGQDQVGGNRESTRLLQAESTLFKKLYVIAQSLHKMEVQLTIQVEQIELWINDYQREYVDEIAQTLVFKVRGEFTLQMSEMVKKLRCTKSPNLYSVHDYAFNDSVDVVKLLLDEDIEIHVKVASISIEQSIVDSWHNAYAVLLDPSAIDSSIRHTKSDLLSSTSVGVKLILKSQFKLDKLVQMEVDLSPLSFRADFKDVALTYQFFKRVEEIIALNKKNLLQRMSTIVNDKVQNSILDMLREGYQQPDEILEPSRIDLKNQIINAKDEEYRKSVEYQLGDAVFQNEPIMFRKELVMIQVSVTQIQIEFCDGQLKSHLRDTNPVATPLLQIQMKSIDFSMGQHQIDDDFDPAQRSTIMASKQRKAGLRRGPDAIESSGDNPPLLEINGCMRVESTYFNQLTQVFEPFVEPWSLKVHVSQPLEGAAFDINVSSRELLNANITYGMALSLKNILVQIREDVAQIDESIRRERSSTALINQSIEAEHLGFKNMNQEPQVSMSSQNDYERQKRSWIDLSSVERPKNLKEASEKNHEITYTVQNHTGLDIDLHSFKEIPFHGDEASQQASTEKQTIRFKKHLNERKLPASPIEHVDATFFEHAKSTSSPSMPPSSVKKQIEDDLLLVDLEVQGTHQIMNVPIENNGVFSYALMSQNPSMPQPGQAGDFQGISDLVNMVVNISSMGRQRLVSFESQLVFENHINYPLTLQFVFKARFEKEIDWTASNDIMTIKLLPTQKFRVPLSWYFLDKHFFSVDVYIVQKKDVPTGSRHDPAHFEDDLAKPRLLLFADITNRFNRTCKDMDTNPYFLKGIEAKIVELNADQHVSIDINGFTCLPKETLNENPIQYLVMISPPLVISNQSMLPLQLFEIDFPGTDQQVEKLQSQIPPSLSDNILSLNLGPTNSSLFKFQFRDNDVDLYITKEFQHFSTKDTKTEKFVRHRGLEPDDEEPAYCHMEMEISPSQGSSTNSLRQQVINESQALKLSIYPKYMVVNKSAVDIYCANQLVKAYSNEMLNLDASKLTMHATNFKESMVINLNSVGLSGVITLQSKEAKNTAQLQFGIKIGLAPAPYNKTTVLTVTPRHVVVNKLDYAVLVKMPTQDSGLEPVLVPKGSACQREIHLQKPSSPSEARNSIQFKIDTSDQNSKDPESALISAQDKALWTPSFQIDQLEDFQTQLQIETTEAQIENPKHAPEWYEPQRYNNWHQIVRVSISPNDDDTTLFVILSNPAVEEFICQNLTQASLQFAKYDKLKQQLIGSDQELDAESSCAFVWNARDKQEKSLLMHLGLHKAVISLDKISQLSKRHKKLQKQLLFSIQTADNGKQRYYSMLRITEDGTKVVSISCGEDVVEELEESKSDLEAQEQEPRLHNGFNLQINLAGFGLSIIDNQPKELLYISIHRIQMRISTEVLKDQIHNQEQRNDQKSQQQDVTVMNEIRSELSVQIGNFQIDNLVNDVMPVVVGARRLYAPHLEAAEDDQLDQLFKSIDASQGKKEESKKEQKKLEDTKQAHDAPFLLLSVSKSERRFQGKVGSIVRFDSVHLAMQEFFVQVETSIMESNLSFILEIIGLFYRKVDHFVQSEQQYDDVKSSKRSSICSYVDASERFEIDADKLKVNRTSFGIIMLGSIKMSLTLQLEKARRLGRDVVTNSPTVNGVVYLLAPVVQNFANISDLLITCNELVILEAFISQDLLSKNITDHYIHQFKRQIFRILGSSDLLGNPANLLSKVGLGFYELARDPLHGILQGPRGFAAGVGTGVQGVVRGVVGGGFESLSHISGSLYSVVKQSAGQEDTRVEKAENISQGVKQGLRGMGTEVKKGVGGIFSKPFQGAKQSGLRGFTAGIGKGLLGAVATPIAGVLRAGESVSQGISGSANNLSNIGKSAIALLDPRSVRARPSRRIDPIGKIRIYDGKLAIINAYLARIGISDISHEQVRFYQIIPAVDTKGHVLAGKQNIFIITAEHLVVLEAINFKNMLEPRRAAASRLVCLKLDRILKYVVLLSPNKQISPAAVGCFYFLSLVTMQNSSAAIEETPETGTKVKDPKAAPPKQRIQKTRSIKLVETQKLDAVNGVLQTSASPLLKLFENGEVTHTIYKNSAAAPKRRRYGNSLLSAAKERTVMMCLDFETFDRVHSILNRLEPVTSNIQAAFANDL